MNLGENIHQYRVMQNMSQGDLADALDVSRQSVSKWENNMATPELDKLIGMKKIFDVSLDELVFGVKTLPAEPVMPVVQAPPTFASILPSSRVMTGMTLLFFGMIFFLLSIFWGDHLVFGEAVGELISSVIVLLGMAFAATYSSKLLGTCTAIWVAYTVTCVGILNVVNMYNYAFMFVASVILFVWFIIWGKHAQKVEAENETAVAA